VTIETLCGKKLALWGDDEEDEENEDDYEDEEEEFGTRCILEAGHEGFHFQGDFYYNDAGYVQPRKCQDPNFRPIERRRRPLPRCRYH
jgi:hypothetical protein